MEAVIGDLIRWEFETDFNHHEGIGLVIALGDAQDQEILVNHMGENRYAPVTKSLLVRWGWVKTIKKPLEGKISTDKPLDGFEPTRDTWVRKDICKVLSQVAPSYLDHGQQESTDSKRRQPNSAER